MRYHDYHLRGYVVMDFGTTIALDLVYDYPGHPKENSTIEFRGVTLYLFLHSAGAIITDITPRPISDIVSEYSEAITQMSKSGIFGWSKSLSDYQEYLEKGGYTGWGIYSAIGFDGFVFGKEVRQKIEE